MGEKVFSSFSLAFLNVHTSTNGLGVGFVAGWGLGLLKNCFYDSVIVNIVAILGLSADTKSWTTGNPAAISRMIVHIHPLYVAVQLLRDGRPKHV